MQVSLFSGLFFSWASMVFISLCTELESSYRSVNIAYKKQVFLSEDCGRFEFHNRYAEECAQLLLSKPSSFMAQWMRVAFVDVKWCGVDKCESLFSPKGIFFSFLAYTIFQATPKVAKRVWFKINNGAA